MALAATLAMGLVPFSPFANAQEIELLILDRIPVPTPRPLIADTLQAQVATTAPAKPTSTVASSVTNNAAAIRGSLKDGLDAIGKKDMARALGIRAGLAAGSLDRKILAWAIALSGRNGVASGEIANIARDLSNWPGQKAMRVNAEKALARERHGANTIISAFGNQSPESVTGAVTLAKAYLQSGNRKAANAALAPFWRYETLGKSEEQKILSEVGAGLGRNDHRFRMHRLFYRDRAKAASRMAGRAEQASLAKARAAVVRKSPKAGKLLEAVAPSSKRDPGYLFARIQNARRSDKYKKAAQLMMQAPKDRASLVHPDEWWVERRLISRHMLDLGDARTAYKIAAGHSAESPSKIAEAEFHAGWYALRFLKNKKLAQKHFANILKVSARPISQARGYYWLARASSGSTATKYYRAAAQHGGTFYGQLASAKLGSRKLRITNPKPNTSQRNRYKNRELVRAIRRLESINYAWRADSIYRHLARTLNDPAELAILSAEAEKRGKRTLALQIGKLAHGRGLPVDTLSWPLGAIPSSAKIGKTGLALAYSIARQESAFNAAAVSPANARGLLQLLPGTAKQMAKKIGAPYSYKRLTRDAGYNATLGAAYLSEQLDNFDNSYVLTFAGYNAGPGRARDWIEKYGDPRGKSIEYVVDWIERIPFTETRNYVQRVMENYQVYKARISGGKFDIVRDLTRGRR